MICLSASNVMGKSEKVQQLCRDKIQICSFLLIWVNGEIQETTSFDGSSIALGQVLLP